MTNNEQYLLMVLDHVADQNTKAVLLQNFISEYGPLSEEAGAKVREILSNEPTKRS